MKEQEAINYLETLEKGQYITVNIPILEDENIPVTAMYMGKDNNNGNSCKSQTRTRKENEKE